MSPQTLERLCTDARYDRDDVVEVITAEPLRAVVYRFHDAEEPEPREVYPAYPWADEAKPATIEDEWALYEAGEAYGISVEDAARDLVIEEWWFCFGMDHARAIAREMLTASPALPRG